MQNCEAEKSMSSRLLKYPPFSLREIQSFQTLPVRLEHFPCVDLIEPLRTIFTQPASNSFRGQLGAAALMSIPDCFDFYRKGENGSIGL
jgi:hypothetical protein